MCEIAQTSSALARNLWHTTGAIHMNRQVKSALAASALILAGQAAAQITFYEGENFRGRAFTADNQVRNFERNGFNDRTSSIVVDRAFTKRP
jgi:hypothetical protein